ncbi:MAG: aminotransferase class I/II-fold pyridoxal phosphate-dependent enzyme [Bryobacter sp.]|nr:aminotransferase class I/II-fold pyridoxal phosphate-dependent enzyme [Bryobacter sp.]
MISSSAAPVDAPNLARFVSRRTENFVESVIREMSRLAMQHGAVNLAQGFPDFPAPADIKQAALDSINQDLNQYPNTWGVKPFRDAIAAKYREHYGLELDPEREITGTCGSTEAMIATLLGITNPGDEVVVFEPFYENYYPDTLLCQAERKLVTLYPPRWTFNPEELRRAFTSRTKAIILNTPHNPTGRVFSREELSVVAALCQEFDCVAISEEIYEHITYDGVRHTPIATLPGMRERTIILNSMSKSYAVTGWRVGWTIAPPEITASIRKVHDFLTVGPPTPLQYAGAYALSRPAEFYEMHRGDYEQKRNRLLGILAEARLPGLAPQGAYYILANIAHLGRGRDVEFVKYMVEQVGVACVPGSSFFETKHLGADWVRFCFCKKDETLEQARERLMAAKI